MRIHLEAFSVYNGELLQCFIFEGIYITNPHISECGRFEVDPTEYYGLTKEEVEEMDRYNSKHYVTDYFA